MSNETPTFTFMYRFGVITLLGVIALPAVGAEPAAPRSAQMGVFLGVMGLVLSISAPLLNDLRHRVSKVRGVDHE